MNTAPATTAQASIYTEFQGLQELRGQAQKHSPEALEKAAKQFEAMFMQMMLKSMREASSGSGLFDNDQSRMYREMYDKQVALSMSDGEQGIGLSDMLVRQLQGLVPGANGGQGATEQSSYPVPDRQSFQAVPSRRASGFSNEGAAAAAAGRTEARPDPASFDSPQEFVETLWPHAERAARRLGADPKALLAQAALETGWGKAVIRHPGGESSHNLFNIKADSRWDGERVAKQTLEYRDGVAVQERAPFRSYDSYAQSFEDYVRFLQDNPRYEGALQRAGDARAFVRELQDAGYATDPKYADKIERILENDVVAALQVPDEGTLT